MTNSITIKQYIWLALIVPFLFFLSCSSDKDNVEISFQSTTGITAAHIFDSFTPFEDGDFDIKKQGWTLNIEVMYYDNTGALVEKESFKSDVLDKSFTSTVSLSPNEYTVIAVAHFTKDDEDYRYWTISNESNINDLSIEEAHDFYTTAFETIGIHTDKLIVKDRPISLNIDIKPSTALFEVYEIDRMLSYIGYKGTYSIKCLKVAQYNIRTVSYQNNIRFKDGKPSYNVSEQSSNYNFAISRPYDRMHENQSPNSRGYTA